MPQTSFAERLQRIENAQGQSVKDRTLIGLSEDLEAEAQKKPQKAKAPRKKGGSMLPLRFVGGFALMFTTFYGLTQMNLIDDQLSAIEALAPHMTLLRAGVGVLVIALMLFFAFKLQRAAFRVLSEPARLPFAIGMVAGLALGIGPVEFADELVAQLSVTQP